MEIRIRLAGGESVTVQADPDALAGAFARAVRAQSALELDGAAGRVLAINPAQVLWWERMPWEEPVAPAPAHPLRRTATG